MVRLPDGGIAVFAEGRKTGTDIGYNDIVYKVNAWVVAGTAAKI